MRLLTQTQAAERLGVTSETIRLRRKAGRFPEPIENVPGHRPKWSLEEIDALRLPAKESDDDRAMSPIEWIRLAEQALRVEQFDKACALAETLADATPTGQGRMLERAAVYGDARCGSAPTVSAPDHAARLARARHQQKIAALFSERERAMLGATLVDDATFAEAGALVGLGAKKARDVFLDCVARL